MTSNEINWLLFSLFVLAALVQASAALVMLWTTCDKRPQGESFRSAGDRRSSDGSRRDPLRGSWGPHWDNRFRRPGAGTAGDNER
jgi:hypothetical protein